MSCGITKSQSGGEVVVVVAAVVAAVNEDAAVDKLPSHRKTDGKFLEHIIPS